MSCSGSFEQDLKYEWQTLPIKNMGGKLDQDRRVGGIAIQEFAFQDSLSNI